MGNMRKSFIAIQLLRPTTMPLKPVSLIIRRPWSVWQIVSVISILSWIKVCSLQGLCYTDLAKVIELTGPENTEYTVRGNLIGHIALIDEEITKVLQDLKIDDQKKKWSSFAMWSWVTMACWNTVVLFVQKSWKQRLFIWSIIWMRKWWWWQQHLA